MSRRALYSPQLVTNNSWGIQEKLNSMLFTFILLIQLKSLLSVGGISLASRGPIVQNGH